jgi:hypothetical protein
MITNTERPTVTDLMCPAIAVVGGEYAQTPPQAPHDWLVAGQEAWQVRSGAALGVLLSSGDFPEPPLLLVYALNEPTVQAAGQIMDVSPVGQNAWKFILGERRDDLAGLEVTVGGHAVTRHHGITYHSARGPGRDNFLAQLGGPDH